MSNRDPRHGTDLKYLSEVASVHIQIMLHVLVLL